MSTYAIVRPTFWAKGSGKALRGDPQAQVLALYLMTCQHANVCGLFRIGLPTISHETGLPASELDEIFSRLDGIAYYDVEEELCFLPNMAKHQIGDELRPNDKRRPKLLRELQESNGHRFQDEFLSIYSETYDLGENKGLPSTEKPLVRIGMVRSSKAKEKTRCPPEPVTQSVIEEMAEFYKVSVETISAAVEECKSYWLVGGGAGTLRTKAGWVRTVRTNVQHKHKNGMLVGLVKEEQKWNN